VNFSFVRTVRGPYLPVIASIPLTSRLSSVQTVVHYDGVLHLNASGSKDQGDGNSMLVTKLDLERKEKVPFENLV
jgi:hypothetical protein